MTGAPARFSKVSSRTKPGWPTKAFKALPTIRRGACLGEPPGTSKAWSTRRTDSNACSSTARYSPSFEPKPQWIMRLLVSAAEHLMLINFRDRFAAVADT